MAFRVEDGTVVPGANSYASVDYATTYFADLGRASEFAGEVDQQRGWLVQATRYIEMRFSTRFIFAPYSAIQPLSFPRGAINGPVIVAWMPDQLLQATCEYAARAKLGPLAPDPVVDKTGHSVVMTARKVGPIERSFAVVPGSRAQAFRSYPAADALIAPLLFARRSPSVIR
jgi:DnaT-like ssDNA binding protein